MKYYFKPEDRLIESDEMVAKYGTEFQIYELGIYPLSVQPDYRPVSFIDLEDGTYYPVESYTAMKLKASVALAAAGYTQEQIDQALA